MPPDECTVVPEPDERCDPQLVPPELWEDPNDPLEERCEEPQVIPPELWELPPLEWVKPEEWLLPEPQPPELWELEPLE